MLTPWKESYDQLAAAKSLQSCLTLCDPIDGSPPGSSVPGILQAKILEWVAISFSNDQLRQRIKKERHYFVNKGPSSQGYDFSSSHVWMWGLDYKESWALKNWCFWTVVLEKTTRRSKQSILKEISPGCSLEELMLKLKLQYFGQMSQWRADSFEKTLMLGKIEGRRRGRW